MYTLKRSCIIMCLFLLLPIVTAHAARSERGTLRLLQGPMIGAVTPTEIRVWVRASGEFPVSIEYDTSPEFTAPIRTESVVPSKEQDDLTAILVMPNLAPDTLYHYRVLIEEKKDPYLGAFSVRSAPAAPARFSIAFGSCPRVQQDPVQSIWKGIEKAGPSLFFWLGDNIYGDTLDPDILSETYRQQRSVPNSRNFLASVPQLAVWDDHDFGLNDHDRTNPIKEQALAVFKRYWANPSYGLAETPGVFFKYAYGGVDFFFLDDRYHRDPNTDKDTPEKTHLGAGQLAWLKQELAASTAPFKILISGGGWSNAKGRGGDSWSAFLHERDALFNYIRDQAITGVILLSGDTHTGEFNAIPWSEQGGYDFYDLDSSPLAQKAGTDWQKRTPELRVRRPYEGNNAGFLEFDLTATPPVVKMNLIDENGKPVWEPVTLTTEDLRNGAATAVGNSQTEK